MKIGMIVHSHTGNTYSVARKLEEKLLMAGHSVRIEQIAPVGGEKTNERDTTKIQLITHPDLCRYDALIFCGPVRGASISPVLAACLAQVTSLKNKKVACLVTEAFPYPWMGGNRAVAQMKNICQSKGGEVCGTGIVNWMGKGREKRIANVIEDLSGLF